MTRWIVLVYRLAREPTAPRMAVWRALQKIEGGYLHDGVFGARATPLADVALTSIAHDIRNYGGEALLLRVSNVDDERLLASKLGLSRAPPKARRLTRRRGPRGGRA